MESIAEKRRRRGAEARPFVIFLAFTFWVFVGGVGRAVTGGLVVAQVAFVVAVVGIAVSEVIMRRVQ